ncbi:bifunctional hydroxymethylpyrimidine kinase/phosphomethylpyrimidine kinase [Thaumasiovibrio subtropicus]|uniref:bifunctional hydroxymethylpyrimidine kinase/phosphomethylpyrimidine kinase n=1 Tax=Thaumasiovibrio subtropicus TaxID=1891207 RepID=UPI000B359A60|nr:bifunctional hydroxymethylpyrimidine kinase/phosphomethylpyrimidine kinase [Thaumasiovibrio subtropicus]
MSTPITLTIAGSDSGGGAGIQADIKAISATGGYACSAITALTAQNTQGVQGILPIDTDFVAQQLDAIFTDLNVKAVKIGMLADSNIIGVVAEKLRQYRPQHIVLDPVMVATSGDLLLKTDAIESLKNELLPLATVITPNLPEAAALTGLPIPHNDAETKSLIAALQALNTHAVLLKGGHHHDDSQATDYLIKDGKVTPYTVARHHTHNTHGTGCTLSSAIASYLAQQHTLHTAVELGKAYITDAIKHADDLEIGKGHGPVNHFFALKK